MKFTFCAKVIKAKETFLLFRICCQCKYGVKAIFNVFALLVIVVQTQSLTYVQVRSKQFKDSICYTCKSIISHSKFNNLTRLCCNRKVANVQLFFTFAMVCEHWVNAVFTIFALRANIMQLKKLHLSKYEQSLSNVVFTFYLLRFCYGCNSVFSCSVYIILNEIHKIPLCSFVHFQYIQADSSIHVIQCCRCSLHSRDKSGFLYTRQRLWNHRWKIGISKWCKNCRS